MIRLHTKPAEGCNTYTLGGFDYAQYPLDEGIEWICRDGTGNHGLLVRADRVPRELIEATEQAHAAWYDSYRAYKGGKAWYQRNRDNRRYYLRMMKAKERQDELYDAFQDLVEKMEEY